MECDWLVSRAARGWLSCQKSINIALSLSLCLPLTTCTATAPHAEPFTGQVVETQTRQPIAGAIVVARWDKTQSDHIAHSSTYCAHVASTTTDHQGYYTLPRYNGDTPTHLSAYRRGYEMSDETYKAEVYLKHMVILRGFKGTREERLKFFSTVWEKPCGEKDGSDKNLLPFYKARYEEIKDLAISEQDRELADGYLTGVEALELGGDAANQRREQRRLERLKEKR